jgi:hypothetical protein
MAKPATLKIDVIADTRNAQTNLSQFSSKVAGFTAGVTASLTTFALDKIVSLASAGANAITDGIDKAANLSASLQTLQRNYGDAAEQVTQWSVNAARGLGLSQVAAVQAANRFATYARLLGYSGTQAAAFSEETIQLAADLAAFNDLPVEDAVNAIGSAFRGERDPLERFGIVLNDVQVKAAYFEKTGEKVTGTLTTQQNIIGTLAAITKQGSTATGAFARESEQLGNKQQVLSAQFDNVKTKIGGVLLPALSEVTGFLADEVIPGVEDVVDAFKEGGLSGAFEEVSEKWGRAWPKLKEKLDGIYNSTTGWIADHIPSWQSWLDAFSNLTGELFTWAGEEIPKLGTRVSEFLKENVPKVGPWVVAFTSWVDKAMNGDPATGEKGIYKRLDAAIKNMSTYIDTHSAEITEIGAKIATYMLAGMAAFGILSYLSIKQALFNLQKAMLEAIPSLAGASLNLAKGIAEGISNYLRNSFGPVLGNLLKTLVTAALNAAFPGLGTAFAFITRDAPASSAPVASGRSAFNGQDYFGGNIPNSIEINVNAGFGTNGPDVGAAIAAELRDYYERNGVPY